MFFYNENGKVNLSKVFVVQSISLFIAVSSLVSMVFIMFYFPIFIIFTFPICIGITAYFLWLWSDLESMISLNPYIMNSNISDLKIIKKEGKKYESNT